MNAHLFEPVYELIPTLLSLVLEDSEDEDDAPLLNGVARKHFEDVEARALAKREANAAKKVKKGRAHRGKLTISYALLPS